MGNLMADKDIILEVQICTYGSRIKGLLSRKLPRVSGIIYRVSVQNPEHEDISEAISSLQSRPDVYVHENFGKGLSNNRNTLLDLAQAPYLLIADDDIDYEAEALAELRDTVIKHPEIDLFTVRLKTEEERIYPSDMQALDTPVRFYSPISCEILVKRSFLERTRIRFSPLAGVNAPFLASGEEDLLLHHFKKAGAKGMFRDIVIGVHDGPTTSTHSAVRPGVLAAKGALLRIIFGPFSSLLRFPVEAYRSKAPWFKAMYYYLYGYLYSIKHRKEL